VKTFTDERGASLAYSDHGEGHVVLALHGAYSTHAEIESILEPIVAPLGGYRRIYPDLPGMGDSVGHETITTSVDVVTLLEDLVDRTVGDQPLIVVGHSYGAHIARGLAARRPGQVVGLVLICPLVPGMRGEEHEIAIAQDDAATLVPEDLRDDFLSYFVIHTHVTAQRFNEAVRPSIGHFDPEVVDRIMQAGDLAPDPDTTRFDQPVLVLLGRNDSLVGYRKQLELIDVYPHATLLLVDAAGHALPHERPALLQSATVEWLTTLERHANLDPSDT
jgi:pimeloyl-ACP methyl ester carboxylesterase